jgi:hypothetical protein
MVVILFLNKILSNENIYKFLGRCKLFEETKHNVYNQTTKSNYIVLLYIVNSLFYVKEINNG